MSTPERSFLPRQVLQCFVMKGGVRGVKGLGFEAKGMPTDVILNEQCINRRSELVERARQRVSLGWACSHRGHFLSSY